MACPTRLELRDRFLSLPEGPGAWQLIDQHRHEVIRLVNHNRRVTVPWHRNQGPAFLNRAINNATRSAGTDTSGNRGRDRQGPSCRHGRCADSRRHPALGEAIQHYRQEVLALAEECDNLHELVERWSENSGMISKKNWRGCTTKPKRS